MDLLSKFKAVFVGKSPESTSPTKVVNSTDLVKVFRTSALVGVAAMVTDLLQNIDPEMFGDYKIIATLVLTALGEVSLRYFKNNSKEAK